MMQAASGTEAAYMMMFKARNKHARYKYENSTQRLTLKVTKPIEIIATLGDSAIGEIKELLAIT